MRKPWNTAQFGVCKDCGREAFLSQHDLCADCSRQRLDTTLEQLKKGEGVVYERWKERLKEALERRLEKRRKIKNENEMWRLREKTEKL